MESQQNGSTYKPQPKQAGLKAMKREVPFQGDAIVVSIRHTLVLKIHLHTFLDITLPSFFFSVFY